MKQPTISSHSSNDDWRLYEFTRNSGLPHGTFDRGVNVDHVVIGLCVVVGSLVALVLAIAQAL